MDEIKKRETYKDVKIGDRNFRIEKFDAYTGSYIAYKLMSEALPMGLGNQLGLPDTQKVSMSKKDFMELQKDCLGVCYEHLPAGITPVLNDNGSFAVNGLEKDPKTVIVLTIHALLFNVSSFFDENLLDSIAKGLSLISQQDAKM